MRVLLTGAAGFIGGRVWAALLAAGYEVVALDAMLPAAHGPGATLPDGCLRVDVRDGDALAPLLAGIDVVCHQAAVVGAGVDAADAPSYASHNDYGTAVLLAQMFAAGVQRHQRAVLAGVLHDAQDRGVVDLQELGVGHVQLEAGDAPLHAPRDRALGHGLGEGHVQAVVHTGGFGPAAPGGQRCRHRTHRYRHAR